MEPATLDIPLHPQLNTAGSMSSGSRFLSRAQTLMVGLQQGDQRKAGNVTRQGKGSLLSQSQEKLCEAGNDSQGPLLTECTSRAGLLPQKYASHRVL